MSTEPVGVSDLGDTICDACTKPIAMSEALVGQEDSEFEGCTLCPECFPTEGRPS